MLTLGIILGLAAALCQSLSYLAARHFVQPRNGGSRRLLVLGHVIMGAISIALLPWIWPRQLHWSTTLEPLLSTTAFYLLGQFGLVISLRHAEPSRISPMLAFKLVILAALTLLVARQPITAPQWGAIAMCIAATIALNYSGGAMGAKAAVTIVLTCIAYSLSDWNIGRLVASLGHLERWRAYLWSTLTCYALCGALAAGLLGRYGSRRGADWRDAAPFAVSWLAAMVCLFACFGTVGVVYGNILQSTRGLISVVLGAVSVRMGLLHLENTTTRGVFARRLLAAALMTGAVILYVV